MEYVSNAAKAEIVAEPMPWGAIFDVSIVHAAAVHSLSDLIVKSTV